MFKSLKGVFKHKDHDQPNSASSTPSSSSPTQPSHSSSSPASTAPTAATGAAPPQPALSQPEPAHLPPQSATSAQQPAPASTTQAMPSSSSNNNHGSASVNKHQGEAEAVVRGIDAEKAKRDASVFDGLPEGLTLGRKMGDGAFSNVFEASLRPSPAQLAIDPTLGKSVKVAVKCVRKFELNSSQVRPLSFSSLRRRFGLPPALDPARRSL